jgi:hypothetical protein
MTPQEFQRTQRKFERIFKGENGDDGDIGPLPSPVVNSTVSHLADLAVEAGILPDRAAALRYLLRTKNGTAVLQRLGPHLRALKRTNTAREEKPALPSAADLRAAKADVVAKLGADAVAVSKAITTSGNTFGLSRDEFVQIIEGHAARQHPTLRKDVAFAKVMEQPEVHQAYRFIKEKHWATAANRQMAMAKLGALPFEVTLEPRSIDALAVRDLDPDEALKQLHELAAEQRKRAPWMTTAQAFAAIYGDPNNATAVQRYKEARARQLGA